MKLKIVQILTSRQGITNSWFLSYMNLYRKKKAGERCTIEELVWLSSILYKTARQCYSLIIFGCGSSLVSYSTKFNKQVLHHAPENLSDLLVWIART